MIGPWQHRVHMRSSLTSMPAAVRSLNVLLQPEPALTDQSRHRERCNSRSRARRTVLATFGKLLRFFQKSLDLSQKKTKKKRTSYSAARGTLPSGAAEPQLPSDAVRVPPSVASLCLFSVGRGSPSGAADPRLPSVAV